MGPSLPVARRRAGREVRSGPKADLIPTPWLMLLASLTEEHDMQVQVNAPLAAEAVGADRSFSLALARRA